MKIVDKIKTVLSRLLISGIDPKRYELRFSVHNYYVANTIYNIVSKAREDAKKEILSGLPPQKTRALGIISQSVEKSGVSDKILLLDDKKFSLEASVRSGQSYRDDEELRTELGVSKQKWDRAVLKVTRRRDPSIILGVSEK